VKESSGGSDARSSSKSRARLIPRFDIADLALEAPIPLWRHACHSEVFCWSSTDLKGPSICEDGPRLPEVNQAGYLNGYQLHFDLFIIIPTRLFLLPVTLNRVREH